MGARNSMETSELRHILWIPPPTGFCLSFLSLPQLNAGSNQLEKMKWRIQPNYAIELLHFCSFWIKLYLFS